VTITGTGGGLTHTTTVTLVVQAPSVGDFTISLSPLSRSVTVGSSTTYTVAIGAQNGFAGVVTFAATGLPTGATASFSPSSVTGSGTSTMTVSTGGNTPKGTYPNVTVTGTSGSLSHASTVSLTVNCRANGKCK
jgi:hypothetical protein